MGNVISRNIFVSNKPDKPLYVDVIDPSATGAVSNNYAEALSVAGLATVTIISYTVPVNKIFRIKRVDFSGGNRAIYKLDINGSTASTKRLYYTNYNGDFDMENLELSAGDIVRVIVENKTNMIADFNTNIIGVLDNA
jgi:hypothetical protein